MMRPARACAIAERLHAGQQEPDGTPILAHIRRVARDVPAEARTVAWLHEALETGAISEQALLTDGLTSDELRALRLLSRPSTSRSDSVYLAHVELIAQAAGPSGHLARQVKVADLQDRRLHPMLREDGWSPPYDRALHRILEATADERGVIAGLSAAS
ncbi:MAG: hypothetical protein ACXVRN_08080 [Solirubrobacteraceae bacterium]